VDEKQPTGLAGASHVGDDITVACIVIQLYLSMVQTIEAWRGEDGPARTGVDRGAALAPARARARRPLHGAARDRGGVDDGHPGGRRRAAPPAPSGRERRAPDRPVRDPGQGRATQGLGARGRGVATGSLARCVRGGPTAGGDRRTGRGAGAPRRGAGRGRLLLRPRCATRAGARLRRGRGPDRSPPGRARLLGSGSVASAAIRASWARPYTSTARSGRSPG